jgi:hypothetical protein
MAGMPRRPAHVTSEAVAYSNDSFTASMASGDDDESWQRIPTSERGQVGPDHRRGASASDCDHSLHVSQTYLPYTGTVVAAGGARCGCADASSVECNFDGRDFERAELALQAIEHVEKNISLRLADTGKRHCKVNHVWRLDRG